MTSPPTPTSTPPSLASSPPPALRRPRRLPRVHRAHKPRGGRQRPRGSFRPRVRSPPRGGVQRPRQQRGDEDRARHVSSRGGGAKDPLARGGARGSAEDRAHGRRMRTDFVGRGDGRRQGGEDGETPQRYRRGDERESEGSSHEKSHLRRRRRRGASGSNARSTSPGSSPRDRSPRRGATDSTEFCGGVWGRSCPGFSISSRTITTTGPRGNPARAKTNVAAVASEILNGGAKGILPPGIAEVTPTRG